MKNSSNTDISDQLDDLAADQLGFLDAWRLRCQIARDPTLAREWPSILGLRNDLQKLSAASANRRPSTMRPPTYTIGGITMNRRSAAAAAGALVLLSVTGALAARHWDKPEANCAFPGVDRDHDWWSFHGQFRGTATLLKPDGTKVNSIFVEGNSTTGSLKFVYTKSKGARSTAAATLEGMGKHPIHDCNGSLLGYIVMSPLTPVDEAQISADAVEAEGSFRDDYQRPERVTPSDEDHGQSAIVPMAGMVGELIEEPVASHGVENVHEHPVSWKSYGDVQVRSLFYAPAEDVKIVEFKKPWRRDLHLAARTLIDEARSLPRPTEQTLADLPPDARRTMSRLFSVAHPTPTTYWAIADAKEGLDLKRGEWKRILQSGKFEGYGRFLVRDTSGRVVLSLDVTRPKRSAELTSKNSNDIVKPQKVVPGWDGEE